MRMIRALVLTVLVSTPAHVLADDPAALRAVELRAAKAVADGVVPSLALALALAKDGRIVYAQAFGHADVAAGVKATTHTAYALASATKPIVATALLAMHERGTIDLARRVETHLPALRLRDAGGNAASVDLLQLLSHTAGLGTYARIHYGDEIAQAAPLEQELARYGVLVQAPGRVAEYSNLGYGLLGAVIEANAGRPLTRVVEDHVFRPLGMRDSYLDVPSRREVSSAVGYDRESRPLPALRNDTPAAGNAYASAHDLLRFGMFHLDPDRVERPPLNRRSVARMQANAAPRALQHYYGDAHYGLGWYVRPDDGGHRVVWHEGGMPGASTIIKLLPERGIVAVVLSNRSDANDLTQSLADELIRAVLPDYRPAPLDPVAGYAPYAGQAEFRGRWVGSILVDGVRIACSMSLDADGDGSIRTVDPTRPATAMDAAFRALVKGDSFVSGFPGRLPAKDIAADDSPLLLLKLVRTGRKLTGAVVAYSSPQRLHYLLPFPIELERLE